MHYRCVPGKKKQRVKPTQPYNAHCFILPMLSHMGTIFFQQGGLGYEIKFYHVTYVYFNPTRQNRADC